MNTLLISMARLGLALGAPEALAAYAQAANAGDPRAGKPGCTRRGRGRRS